MLTNYIKIAWRNISKHRFYSLVNIIGLFAGISFSLLIGAFVWSETQVNKNLRNANRQYILKTVSTDPNLANELVTFGPLAKRLKEEYPTLVANFYRYDGVTSVVSKGDKHFREGVQISDSTLLEMYGFKLLHGDAATALDEPFSVVITGEKAIKYFGKTDVIGETLNIQNFSGSSQDFRITAVMEDPTTNSITKLVKDYPNTIFVPMSAMTYFQRLPSDSWNNIYIPSYIELKEGVEAKDLEAPIAQLIKENADVNLAKQLGVQPVLLNEYYLDQDKSVVRRMLNILSWVGIFILLMAIVNFINIAISRSGSRLREIGVRKVLGSLRRQLIFQFLAESIVLVLIATVAAVMAYPYLRPVFAGMVGGEVPALSAFPSYFLLILLALVIFVGCTAGIYPALVLSAIKSVDSIKGKLRTIGDKIFLRKSLMAFQFSTALFVLVGAAVVSRQVSHFFSQSLGYDKEFIVSAQVPRDWSRAGVQKMNTVRNEFAQLPGVKNVSLSYEIPNGNNGGQASMYAFGKDSTQSVVTQVLSSDGYYLSLYGIGLKSGRFIDEQVLDSSKLVLNETAVKAMGFASNDAALNQQIRFQGDRTVYTIQRVMSDFHFGTMRDRIAPMVVLSPERTNSYRFLSFKLNPGNVTEAIASIERKWASLLPGTSFEYRFMDETLERLYASELQLRKAAQSATVIAFIIVILGVLGLVTLTIHKRIKEIGIRKVLGASFTQIVALFAREFAVIVLLAGLITCPIAWWMMNTWLNTYAYRIELNSTPFVVALLVLATITLLLVTLQVIGMVRNNIIKSLKTE